jgi:hypothetical protein
MLEGDFVIFRTKHFDQVILSAHVTRSPKSTFEPAVSGLKWKILKDGSKRFIFETIKPTEEQAELR